MSISKAQGLMSQKITSADHQFSIQMAAGKIRTFYTYRIRYCLNISPSDWRVSLDNAVWWCIHTVLTHISNL